MHLPEINVLDVMKTADRLKARRCRKAGCGPQLTCPRAPGGRNLAASRAPPTKGQLHGGAANWQSRPEAAGHGAQLECPFKN